MSILGNVDAIHRLHLGEQIRHCIVGWARSSEMPQLRLILEVMIDDYVIGTIVGDHVRHDLVAAGFEDGRYGFSYPIPERFLDGKAHTVKVRDRQSGLILPRSIGFQLQLLSSKIAVCAIVRDEARYLVEWIAHHLIMNVDHFFIYNNQSCDDSIYILAEMESAGIVTQVQWPSRDMINPQVLAYRDCLTRCRGQYNWLGFLDLDEFFRPIAGDGLNDVLSVHDGADAVAFNWRIFGSGGAQVFDKRPVTRRFTHCATRTFEGNRFFKTFARPKSIAEVHVHQVRLSSGLYVTSGGFPIDANGLVGKTTVTDYTTGCINHYFSKSQEEWDLKRQRGLADRPSTSESRIRPETHFLAHDRNEEIDESLLRFSDRLRTACGVIDGYGYFCSKHSPNFEL